MSQSTWGISFDRSAVAQGHPPFFATIPFSGKAEQVT
jgi:hypothetical protein